MPSVGCRFKSSVRPWRLQQSKSAQFVVESWTTAACGAIPPHVCVLEIPAPFGEIYQLNLLHQLKWVRLSLHCSGILWLIFYVVLRVSSFSVHASDSFLIVAQPLLSVVWGASTSCATMELKIHCAYWWKAYWPRTTAFQQALSKIFKFRSNIVYTQIADHH